MQAERSRRDLALGLESRRREIEETVALRAYAIDKPDRSADSRYLEGLRQAIQSAIDFTIEACEKRDGPPAPVPDPILAQARLAARRGVSSETMMRRYLAGHAILSDFVLEEAERREIPPRTVRAALRSQAAATDRALATISATYLREKDALVSLTAKRWRSELVGQLLDGELVDPSGLHYAFDRWHIAMVHRGNGGEEVARAARNVDAERLVVEMDDGSTFVWFGSRKRLDSVSVETAVADSLPRGTVLGIGEPAKGRSGWRLTLNQAQAALSVAARRRTESARYAEVALVASAIQDDLLLASLRQIYVVPLAEKEGGPVLLETLRTYFESDQSVTATAAALSVSRNTVANRLRAIEKVVGYLRSFRVADCMVALLLDDLPIRTTNAPEV